MKEQLQSGIKMQKLQVDKKIKALEEQIELLKSFISKREPLITIEDYRKYLAKTKKLNDGRYHFKCIHIHDPFICYLNGRDNRKRKE